MPRKKKTKKKTEPTQKQSQSVKNIINITTAMDRARRPKKKRRPARTALAYPTNDLTPLMMSMMIQRNQQPPAVQPNVAESLANARKPLREQGQVLGHGIREPISEASSSGVFMRQNESASVFDFPLGSSAASFNNDADYSQSIQDNFLSSVQEPSESSEQHSIQAPNEPSSQHSIDASPGGGPSQHNINVGTQSESKYYKILREKYPRFKAMYDSEFDENVNLGRIKTLIERYLRANGLTHVNDRPQSISEWEHKLMQIERHISTTGTRS